MVVLGTNRNEFPAVHPLHAVQLRDGFDGTRELFDVGNNERHWQAVVQFERRPRFHEQF
jgi:hypothetical protein